MFNRQNPNLIGFSPEQIETIEDAWAALIGDDDDPTDSLLCHLTNCWQPGMTTPELIETTADLGWDGVRA